MALALVLGANCENIVHEHEDELSASCLVSFRLPLSSLHSSLSLFICIPHLRQSIKSLRQSKSINARLSCCRSKRGSDCIIRLLAINIHSIILPPRQTRPDQTRSNQTHARHATHSCAHSRYHTHTHKQNPHITPVHAGWHKRASEAMIKSCPSPAGFGVQPSAVASTQTQDPSQLAA